MATGGSTRKIPTQAEVLEYFDSLSNWGRWGPDDQLGTLNYITPCLWGRLRRLRGLHHPRAEHDPHRHP